MLFLNDVRVTLPELLAMNTEGKTIKDYQDKKTGKGKRRVWILAPELISINSHNTVDGDEDSAKKIASGPASTNIMTSFTFYDKEGARKTLRYADNYTPATNFKPALYEPIFITITHTGHLMVDDMEKNYFLERHPQNGSLPEESRPKDTTILYGEYNPGSLAKPHMQRVKDVIAITTRILEMSIDELKSACLKAIDNNQVTGIPDIELATEESMQSALCLLLNNARDPWGWCNATIDKYDNMLLLAVNQAKENKRIEFDIAKREWRFTNKKLDAAKRFIIKVDAKIDPNKALLEHIAKLPFEKQDAVITELTGKEQILETA